MAVLFAKSFLPDYVHFSNDGPLGEINTAWAHFPGTLTGTWDDLNELGTSGGAAAPDVTQVSAWLLGPVGFSKFYVPIAMFVLGIGAWTFFRQLKLSPLAAALGALATTLNSCYMGNACWGTVSQQIAIAMVFFALALVLANTPETLRPVRWARYMLAGICVGFSVMEGADNGAIFSLFVAAFVFFKSLVAEGAPMAKRIGLGIGRVAVIACFAGLVAAQTISGLLGAYVVGSAGMGNDQNKETPLEHWDWATQWSLPKTETIGVFVPGVFGYRLDTPKDMMSFLQDSYTNGEYWGGVGRTPALDRYFDGGSQGKAPDGPILMRFGYAGYYGGIMVVLVALFAIVQSLRKENSIFPLAQRQFVWFWTATLIIALLLMWGRFAPFYQLLYHLPYFSTIRNPVKFTAIFFLGLIIVFAYGMDALSRGYLVAASGKPTNKPNSKTAPVKSLSGFDRNWILFSVIAFAISVVAWFIYASQTDSMVHYLKKVGFSDPVHAKEIFNFSVGQAGWSLVLFAVAITLVILVLRGFFSGKRAMMGGLLLGAFVVLDLGRADLPFIIHWDYTLKYEIDPKDSKKSTNPIITILCDKPYEHRITALPSDGLFENLYRLEWMQHHFPYYNVQCSDIIQSSRVASDLMAYDIALRPTAGYLVTRRWQLNNTRYLFGPAAELQSINDQIDPVQRRFQILQQFSIVPKPGVDLEKLQQDLEHGIFRGEQFTAVPDTNGNEALFEFTGALPRAKLYSNWQVSTNAADVLKTLASENFDPQKTVLVTRPLPDVPANSTGDNSGAVDYKSYSPKDIVLSAQADKPSILLLNDKYDPGWHVTVDGQPAQILHCNYIMRGVYLTPGAHTVAFHFGLSTRPLFVTSVAIAFGILLCGYLFYFGRKPALAAKK